MYWIDSNDHHHRASSIVEWVVLLSLEKEILKNLIIDRKTKAQIYANLLCTWLWVAYKFTSEEGRKDGNHACG